MAGAVHVRVVTVLRLVLDRRGVDGDPTGAFLRRGVDLIVLLGRAVTHSGQGHGERGGESGLAVVDVADGADVDMRLLALELAARRSHGKCAAAALGVVARCGVEDGGGAEEERGGKVGFCGGFGNGFGVETGGGGGGGRGGIWVGEL